MAAFNACGSKRWTKTLHFPHVRLAGDKVQVWETAEDYIMDDDKSKQKGSAGWDHSR